MTDAAIIAGSLVDAKNVNTHKVMRLIIDVPAENALKVIAAFGWPTMVNPVSVAVARLNEVPAPSGVSVSSSDEREPASDPGLPAERERPKKSPAQIAGYLCTLPSFHKFLTERFSDQWLVACDMLAGDATDADLATYTVRTLCNVNSRADIKPDNTEWLTLMLAFRLWEKEAEVVPA